MFESLDELWGLYNQDDGAVILGGTSEKQAEQIIRVLAHEQEVGKENWCMGILECVRPDLHEFIACWTGGGYEDIRHAQESGSMPKKLETLISKYLSAMHLLPEASIGFVHYSKDSSWSKRYAVGDTFSLRSFMGCAVEGSEFVHARVPRIFFYLHNRLVISERLPPIRQRERCWSCRELNLKFYMWKAVLFTLAMCCNLFCANIL